MNLLIQRDRRSKDLLRFKRHLNKVSIKFYVVFWDGLVWKLIIRIISFEYKKQFE